MSVSYAVVLLGGVVPKLLGLASADSGVLNAANVNWSNSEDACGEDSDVVAASGVSNNSC